MRQIARVLVVLGPLFIIAAIWMLATGTSWWQATPGLMIGVSGLLQGIITLKDRPKDQPPPDRPQEDS